MSRGWLHRAAALVRWCADNAAATVVIVGATIVAGLMGAANLLGLS